MRYLIIFSFICFFSNLFGSVTLICKARYQYKFYNENSINVGKTSTKTFGSGNVYVPNQGGYYETKTTPLYTLNITFYSGFELNQFYKNEALETGSVFALVKWTNGGFTFVKINNFTTKLKILTEEGIKFNQYNQPVSQMIGVDTEDRTWEFNF